MSYNTTEERKISQRDLFIIVGTVIALAVAGFIVARTIMADQPYVAKKVDNPPGFSEKSQSMESAPTNATSQQNMDTGKKSPDDYQP